MLFRNTNKKGIKIGTFCSINAPKKAVLKGALPLAKKPNEIKIVRKYAIRFFFSQNNFLNTYLTYLSIFLKTFCLNKN